MNLQIGLRATQKASASAPLTHDPIATLLGPIRPATEPLPTSPERQLSNWMGTKGNENAGGTAWWQDVSDPKKNYETVAGMLQGDDRKLLEQVKAKGLLDQKDSSGRTMLDSLTTLSTASLANGVQNRDVVSQLLRDVDNTVNIRQGGRNTCGPTSASIHLAQTKPAEYARMIKDLATYGETRLPAVDKKISVKPDALTDDSGRTVTGRLLQPALMEYGNDDAHYDNRTQEHSREVAIPGRGPVNVPGLAPREMQRVWNGLFGEKPELLGADPVLDGTNLSTLNPLQVVTNLFSPDRISKALNHLGPLLTPGSKPNYKDARQALQTGRYPALAMLDVDVDKNGLPAEGLHWVLVKDVKDGRVYFEDPNRFPQATIGPGENQHNRPAGYAVDDKTGLASLPVSSFDNAMWSMLTTQEAPFQPGADLSNLVAGNQRNATDNTGHKPVIRL